MAIETAYSAMMSSTVVIQNQTGTDKYGKLSFGSGTNVQSRIVPTKQSSRSATGIEIKEQGRIYCYGTPTVAVDDKITLPGGDVVYAMAIQVQHDESGAHHTVITIGSGR